MKNWGVMTKKKLSPARVALFVKSVINRFSSGNYQLILRRLDNDGKKVDRQARRKIERKERSKEGMHQAANA